jgi:hypothetical protein
MVVVCVCFRFFSELHKYFIVKKKKKKCGRMNINESG